MSWPDVKAWCRAARARLIGARVALLAAVRAEWTGDLAANLRPAASASPVCYLDEADPDYLGFLSDADLAAALRPLAAPLAPERLPLLEFVLWRLAGAGARRVAETGAPADMQEYLSRLAPRIRDDAIHRAVDILRRSIESKKK